MTGKTLNEKQKETLLNNARVYAALGLELFPVQINKKPLTGFKWKENSSNNIERIKAFIKMPGCCGLGVKTGGEKNLFILDIDKKDGVDGYKSIEKLEADISSLPVTLSVITGSGGEHRYFFLPEGHNMSIDAGLYEGLDYRCEGGFGVIAGSYNEKGQYQFINKAEIAELPETWVSALNRSAQNTSSTKNLSVAQSFQTGNRNNSLARMLGSWRRQGMGQEQMEHMALAFNETISEPLDEAEVIRTVQSICRYTPSDLYIFTNHQDFTKEVAKHLEGQVTYASGLGFMILQEGVWCSDPEELRVRQLLENVIEGAVNELELLISSETDGKNIKAINKIQSKIKQHGFQKSCIERLKNQPDILRDSEEFDKHARFLGVKNGILDLVTGELCENLDGDIYVTKRCNVDYDPEADCPIFKKVLEQIQPDSKVQKYLLSCFAYALSGMAREDKMFFFLGEGQNGKTLLLEVMSYILGDYSVTLDPSTIMKSNQSNHFDLVRLKGARLVCLSETNSGQIADSSLLKRVTGGDTISARGLYRQGIQFQNIAVPFCASNYAPVIDGNDGGMTRRLRMIKFTVIISDKDKDTSLPEKLKSEASGIFNLLLDALKEYKANGLIEPESVMGDTQKYCDTSNLFKQFINDSLEFDDESQVAASKLYSLYRNWAIKNGLKPVSNPIFSQAFSDQTGIEKVRSNKGNVWKGIKPPPPTHDLFCQV